MASVGIHHITAICGDPRRNVAFYTGTLGLRMVKRTVNFDDPTTWHLYYGDETGRPGTALTFFAWTHVAHGRNGIGLAVETAFVVPQGSLGFWTRRLGENGVAHSAPEERFGETVIGFSDPDDMRLELVARRGADRIPGWSGNGVPAEHAIRGFAGVTLWVGETAGTAAVLTEAFGFTRQGREENRHRFVSPGSDIGTIVDLRAAPGFPKGRMGRGSVHHVAFRAAGDAAQAEMAQAARAQGLNPTQQIDRLYFRSVYFREPEGILFEIATDEPGFTADEPKEALGQSLRLPPWHEPQRAAIAAALPPIAYDS
jgi:glyoxalase family protein